MIRPVNGHLLIDPLAHEGFIASQRETYEEIGIVLDYDRNVSLPLDETGSSLLDVGVKVYFDSWLAAKYPVDGETDKFYWLVKIEDIRAIEKVPK